MSISSTDRITATASLPGDETLWGMVASRASEQDGSYPRPQLVRDRWLSLDGEWAFSFDDDNIGIEQGWWRTPDFGSVIRVPFPPESPASGVSDTGFHAIAWYSRELTADELASAGLGAESPVALLHFGAVDYRAHVWVDGTLVGGHEGGHTPFTVDMTAALDGGRDIHLVVVRVEDDPHDVTQPRGKQDWRVDPHVIWYHRTTGIWQPVWFEAVPALSVETVRWSSDIVRGTVDAEFGLRGRVPEGARLRVDLSFGDRQLAAAEVPIIRGEVRLTLSIAELANGQSYEELLWSPDAPRLVDATVGLTTGDTVSSYLGLRSVAVDRGVFLLNDRPIFLRSVLSQGYWPESHLAAPSSDALRREVELILELGFNAARVHQKIEDPRFHHWADRLGLMIWGEAPAAFEFSTRAVTRFSAEWSAAVLRDASHPSVVTWVPVNESWGVQHIAHDPAQQAFARSLFDLTKALDPTRPVVSNDGWEQQESDIWTIHDYDGDSGTLALRYADDEARARLFSKIGPAGRRILLDGVVDRGQPVMLTEFGGVHYAAGEEPADAWGYSNASSAADFADRVGALLHAVRSSRLLAGFCYTQLTDTLQEANGLLTEAREPKLPMEQLRAIISGRPSR